MGSSYYKRGLGHENEGLDTQDGSLEAKKRLFALTEGVETLKMKLWALKEGYGG